MPSIHNLPVRKKICKPNTCIFCQFNILWVHSYYTRKGTHSKIFKNEPQPVEVVCLRCLNPECKRFFSVLPAGTLPYCRFTSEDFFSLALELQEGTGVYSLWKSWSSSKLGIKVFSRLHVLVQRVMLFIIPWVRELTQPVTSSLNKMAQCILDWVTWFTFTTRWYHALYPRRLWPESTPDNSAP